MVFHRIYEFADTRNKRQPYRDHYAYDDIRPGKLDEFLEIKRLIPRTSHGKYEKGSKSKRRRNTDVRLKIPRTKDQDRDHQE